MPYNIVRILFIFLKGAANTIIVPILQSLINSMNVHSPRVMMMPIVLDNSNKLWMIQPSPKEFEVISFV